MFTNNYVKHKRCLFLGTTVSYTRIDGNASNLCNARYGYSYDIGVIMKTARCQTMDAEYYYNSSSGNSIITPYGVYFGTGNTPATVDDYALESLITDGLTITNQETVHESTDGNGNYTFSASYILQNTSGEDITIREVGMYGNETYYYSATYYNYPILHERQVLASPVTIPAGEAKMFTYKVTFNQSQ